MKCSICRHPQRLELEIRLVSGATLREIARQFRVSKDALWRHQPHIDQEVHAAKAHADENRAISVLAAARGQIDRIGTLVAEVEQIYLDAKKAGNDDIALRAIKEMRGCYAELRLTLDLVGDFNGERRRDEPADRPTQVVVISPGRGSLPAPEVVDILVPGHRAAPQLPAEIVDILPIERGNEENN